MLPVLVLALAFHPPADTSFLVGGTEVPMVRIEAGSFHRDTEVGQQHVILTSGFYLGATEVTWATWDGVMGWTDGRDQPDYPARRRGPSRRRTLVGADDLDRPLKLLKVSSEVPAEEVHPLGSV